MKKLAAAVILALSLFYVAWPAWSGYRISQAFKSEDKDLLASKVDFEGVRASLKPAVTTEIEARLERAKREAGPLGGLIAGTFKDDLVTRMVEGTLTSVVTPENVLRIVRQGGNLREAVERVALEQFGRSLGRPQGKDTTARLPGGLPGPTAGGPPSAPPARTAGTVEPAPSERTARADSAQRPPLGLGNVKRFSVTGPLSFTVGVARDVKASEPDVTVVMAFTGGDWKVVSVVPKL